MPLNRVVFQSHVVDSLLTYSRMAYPNEGILILRGKSKKGIVEVTGVMVPPAATHGGDYSSFNWFMLPVDMSYIGVAHSHPSGAAHPSHQDVLHATGKVMVIMGYPYRRSSDLGVFDHNGNPLPFEVIHDGTPAAPTGIPIVEGEYRHDGLGRNGLDDVWHRVKAWWRKRKSRTNEDAGQSSIKP